MHKSRELFAGNVVLCSFSLRCIVQKQVNKNSPSTMHFGRPEIGVVGDEFLILCELSADFQGHEECQ